MGKRIGKRIEKQKKMLIIFLIIIIIILLTGQKSFANNFASKIKSAEYTEEYKKYLGLSEEEKEKVLEPRMFKTFNTQAKTTNLFRIARNIGSGLETRYSLKDIIPNNVIVKDQKSTNSCWAFATLSSLETNLALNNEDTAKIYDFSERHMEYATSRFFANDIINKNGLRELGKGGSYFRSTTYLTNGQGAINEEQMPFENNENTIELKEIQNKNITSQVYDTEELPIAVPENINQVKQKMKEHIKTYGSLYAAIYGATPNTEYNNNSTGAIYCDNKESCPINHGISIIGWDDNYAIENFNENHRPKNPGAWIIRNSWGEKLEYTLKEMRGMIFNSYTSECIEQGWTEESLIPDEFVKTFLINNGYAIEGDKAIMKIGDNGIMYVSYEDVNIYQNVYGITKSSDKIDYENIYQYDYTEAIGQISYETSKIYLGNIFNKKTSGPEYLTQVSIFASETYTCTVYVNPNGSSKSKEDLQKVKLKTGDTETFNAGYHTLEFEKPIQIKANDFAVVIEIQGVRPDGVSIYTESNEFRELYSGEAEIENGKCFFTIDGEFEKNNWQDLSKMSEANPLIANSDSKIKAFTVSKIDDDSLREIVITTPPVKTTYKEGENFNKNGMVVTAYYNNGKSKIITDYNITNGTNLKKDQTSITITYEDKTITQPIKVEKSSEGETPNPDDKKPEGETPNPDDKKPEQSTVENSNFENATFSVKNLKHYTFTDKTKEEYMLMKINIEKVKKNNNNDRYEYYYYLSPNKNETNIENWVKIKETQDSEDKISFSIDTRDIKNYKEIINSEITYLYIKEVAVKGGDQKVSITRVNDTQPQDGVLETYVDNVKTKSVNLKEFFENNTGNTNSNASSNNINNSSKNANNLSDNTLSAKKLPNAGKTAIIMFIIVVTILGIILFARYKNLSKYVK